MNQKERLAEVLKILENRKKISQEELMEIFSISRDTARRDILKLVESSLVERYPGGISRPLLKKQIETYSNRLIKKAKEKQVIADAATELLGQKMTIYLDVSTTVNFLASELVQKELVIVTNSMDNAVSASKNEDSQVYLLGGFFKSKSRVLHGEPVLYQIKNFNFDIAFIGGAGISEEGIFYSELTDIYLKEEIIKNAQKVCLLIDSSKVNNKTAYKIDLSRVDVIVTDKPFSKEIHQTINLKNIEVRLAKGK